MPGTTRYYHYDACGNTRQLTDSDQNVTDTYVHTGFGEEVAQTGASENSFRWGGRLGYYFDADTGNNYVRARHYQPNNARWMSQDPIGFAGGDWNLYRYVFNTPVNATDALGLLAVKFVGNGIQVSEPTPWFQVWAGAGIYADRNEETAGFNAGGATLVYRRSDSWRVKEVNGAFSGIGISHTWHLDKVVFGENGRPKEDKQGVRNGKGGAMSMADGSIAIGYIELFSVATGKYIQEAIRQNNKATKGRAGDIKAADAPKYCTNGNLTIAVTAKYYLGSLPANGFNVGGNNPFDAHSIVEFIHKPWRDTAPEFWWNKQAYSITGFHINVGWQTDPTTKRVTINVSGSGNIGSGPQRPDGFPRLSEWSPDGKGGFEPPK